LAGDVEQLASVGGPLLVTVAGPQPNLTCSNRQRYSPHLTTHSSANDGEVDVVVVVGDDDDDGGCDYGC
jgi:hypothetical protein